MKCCTAEPRNDLRDPRPVETRYQRGARRSKDRIALCRSRRQCHRWLAGRVPQAHCGGNREMGQGGQVRGHQAGMKAAATGNKRFPRLGSSLRQRPRDLTCTFDEELGGRTERTVLEREDSNLHVRQWQVDGQDLEFYARGGEPQCGRREDRKKAPGREQTHPHVGGHGEDRGPGVFEPALAKGRHCERPSRIVGWRQHPRLAEQFAWFDCAAPSPPMLGTSDNEIGVFKQKLESLSLVRIQFPSDQEVELPLAKFAVQHVGTVRGYEMKYDAWIALR